MAHAGIGDALLGKAARADGDPEPRQRPRARVAEEALVRRGISTHRATLRQHERERIVSDRAERPGEHRRVRCERAAECAEWAGEPADVCERVRSAYSPTDVGGRV